MLPKDQIFSNNLVSSEKIFSNSSKTFHTATSFFPTDIKQSVTDFYAFVRIPDNFIDSTNPDISAFQHYKESTQRAFNGNITNIAAIDRFVELSKIKGIQKDWIDSFFNAMESDLHIKRYETYEQLEKYVYGSAEVIGLVMARLMDLPQDLDHYAKLLGKSMQIANFIRDIPEDLTFGRVYLPEEDLKRFDVTSLIFPQTEQQKKNFVNLIRFEISRYGDILKQAEPGIKNLPKRYRVPVKTASDMYSWMMDVIDKNPLIIFERKVKPTKNRIIMQGLFNMIFK